MKTLLTRLALPTLFAGLLALVTSPASAALVPFVGGKLIYDTDLDITWAADANLCVALQNCVNGDATGGMVWTDAKQWAADLSYLGFSDWRLPTTGTGSPLSTCSGYNCTDSEMGHLYYSELSGVLYPNQGYGIVGDRAPFSNIQAVRYWSETIYDPPVAAWIFDFNFGGQAFEVFGFTDDHLAAWAVRSGRPHGIPEPSTLALALCAVAGLFFATKRNVV